MQRILGLAALAIAGLSVSSMGFADTLQMFTVSGDFVDPTQPSCGTCTVGAFGGTLTIDTTAGSVVAGDLSASTPTGAYSFAGAPSGQGPVGAGGRYNQVDDWAVSLGQFYLALDIPQTLVGYAGGSLCSYDDDVFSGCDGLTPPLSYLSLDPGYYVFDGAATPGAMVTTPEPSTFALLGTGLVGAAGAVRRRRRHC